MYHTYRHKAAGDRGLSRYVPRKVGGVWSGAIQGLVMSSSGPKFQVPPHNVSTYEGLPVAIPCTTEKTPDHDIFLVWRKEGQPLYQDDTITIATNGSLIIQRSRVKHSGTYDCMAVSGKGVSMATIFIQILTRPSTLVQYNDNI